MNMKQLDQALRNSFHFVQNDMIALENQQYELLRRIERLEKALLRKAFQQQPVVLRELVGNVQTREVHASDCLLARSMNQRYHMIFSSKNAAREAGFTECVCLS